MVAPTIIGLVVLNLWPFVQTIYTSFCEHLGFGHYKNLYSQPRFTVWPGLFPPCRVKFS